MEHWIDISDEGSDGVTFISPDMPLFEAGKITMDEVVYGWVGSIAPTQTVISYAMNNYWETNYAAAQEGKCTFRYIIRPHKGNYMIELDAEKEAIGQSQPLITNKGGAWMKAKVSLIDLKNKELVITTVKPVNKGKAILVCLNNAGNKEEIPDWGTKAKIALSDVDGQKEDFANVSNPVKPGAIRYFKIFLQ